MKTKSPCTSYHQTDRYNIMKRTAVTIGWLLLLSASNAVVIDEKQEQGSLRSLQDYVDPEPDSWIVQFAPETAGVAFKASKLAKIRGGKVGAVYTSAIKGFAYKGKDIEGISQNPNVISVTRDSIQTITAQTIPSGIRRVFAPAKNFMKAASSGCFCDAVVAVIDTGVDFTHPDLRVNKTMSVDCTSGVCKQGAGLDDHGHGTHVSGTIAGINNTQGVVGVCPGAEIWAIKVLGSTGSGKTSWILAGIDYVAQHAATVDVINMSLGGGGCDSAYCAAITAAKNAGIAFAVAAGNSNALASGYTPACCADALTVSSLADSDGLAGSKGPTTCRGTVDDKLSSFSNYGSAVNIAAPGECIYSTYKGSSYTTMSGTSMASPHVAGALAILASNNHNSDVKTMYSTLTSTGNFGFTDKDNIKEPLLDLTKLPDATMRGTCTSNLAPLPPTKAPSKKPTMAPTKAPTKAPSLPTNAPTKKPTIAPTKAPSKAPLPPTKLPTKKPTNAPTKKPTKAPTKKPTKAPTKKPTKAPTKVPTQACIVKGSLCSITPPTPSCCSGSSCKFNGKKSNYFCA